MACRVLQPDVYRFILTASVCAIVAQLDRAFILLSEENKKSEPFSYREKVRIFIVWCTMQKYPYLVIEKDGRIEGYAYAGPFVGRAAYDWACELTIYLDHNAQKCGMGRTLYEALASRLQAMGILNLYACIGHPQVEDEYLTKNSAQFHAHLGFALCGTFRNCGYKFGRWYDMVWMEKIIGELKADQPPVQPYTY